MFRSVCVRGLEKASRLCAALLRDRAGNVLILTTFMLIPLTALIGSGIDISRVYVARARMQQACDAASLAGRWASSAGQSTDQITAEATKYFNFNFKQRAYGTAAFTPAVSVTGTTTKTVTVNASTTMPMSIMTIFKFQPMPVTATCTAMQDYVNTDIVLVLDVTGSMVCLPSDTPTACSNWISNNPGVTRNTTVRSTSRLAGLRDAVMALYDQLAPIQTQLTAANMRLRYSIVPYSSTVNVGKLLYGTNNANSYIRNPADYRNSTERCTQTTRYNGNTYCTASTYDTVSVNHPQSWFNNTWNGCIEERGSTSSITPTTNSIPSAAYDLNIDLPADSVATRWPPYDPVYADDAGRQTACPFGSKRLTAWTRSDMQTYVNSLSADGGTYHDIGMIWGGRMISSGGVFSDSPATFNSMPTKKFLIFMTDGDLQTGLSAYTAYGVERYDQRVTGGTTSEQDDRHLQRFKLMCNAVKDKGVSIWVVAFAQALTTELTNCASNAGQASTSANSTALIDKFKEIGTKIGALRLTS